MSRHSRGARGCSTRWEIGSRKAMIATGDALISLTCTSRGTNFLRGAEPPRVKRSRSTTLKRRLPKEAGRLHLSPNRRFPEVIRYEEVGITDWTARPTDSIESSTRRRGAFHNSRLPGRRLGAVLWEEARRRFRGGKAMGRAEPPSRAWASASLWIPGEAKRMHEWMTFLHRGLSLSVSLNNVLEQLARFSAEQTSDRQSKLSPDDLWNGVPTCPAASTFVRPTRYISGVTVDYRSVLSCASLFESGGQTFKSAVRLVGPAQGKRGAPLHGSSSLARPRV